MESENVTHINLSINYLRDVDVNELCFENMNEKIIELLKQLFSNGDDVDVGGNDKQELAEQERMEIFNQVSAVKH